MTRLDKKPEGGPVDVYRMACFYLKVLDQANGVGWDVASCFCDADDQAEGLRRSLIAHVYCLRL